MSDFIPSALISIRKKVPSTAQLDREIRSMQKEEVRNLTVGKWIEGNDVLITDRAAETNQWKLEFIQAAEHSIEISGSICGGKVFREALHAIEKRLEEQSVKGQLTLQVRILTTPDLLEKEDIKLLENLKKKYPDQFHPLISSFKFDSQLYRVENHVKLMIVDEKYYIIGGTNYQDRLSHEAEQNEKPAALSDKLLGSGSNDMDVVGKGEKLASVMRREFYKLYAILEHKENPFKKPTLQNHYAPILQNQPVAVISRFDAHPDIEKQVPVKAVTGCSETSVNGCTEAYSKLVEKSDKRMTIAQMYFDPDSHIKKAIKENPVPIKVITAGVESGSPYANQFYAYANRNYYCSLLQKSDKTEVYTYANGNNIFHKKVGIFERSKKEALTAIGSYNWGGKSHKDYEMIVVIKSNKVAEQTLKIIEKDIKKSQPISQEKAKEVTQKRSLKWGAGVIQHQLYPILVG